MRKLVLAGLQPKKWIVLGCLSFLAGCVLLFSYANLPVSDRIVVADVYIPRGASFLQSVDILDGAGMVGNRLLFSSLVLLKGVADKIKAGEYELSTGMSPREIIDKLARGDIKIRRVTIPEDYTLRQIADRLAAESLISVENFLSTTTDAAFLSSLHIEAASAEGYLYPDTYDFFRGMTSQEIARTMINRFWEKVTQDMIAKAKQFGLTTSEMVTLASLIGKETGHEREKARVSAVFHNRLKKGMKLQSDPTAVYSLTQYQHTVSKKDLDNNSSYNTYKIRGLPPGPIANPGVDSIHAALNPAPVRDLYFVSKNDGTHMFSSNLAEHTKAVLKYQIKRKKE